MSVNQKLLKVQEEWKKELFVPYIENHPDLKISKPFAFGISETYNSDNTKKIMIVGQQTNGYRSYYDTDESYRCDQSWSIEYCEKQLGEHPNNHSHFWNLFRNIKQNGMIPYWNNINNAEQYDNKSHYLNPEAETILNSKMDGKSLLEKQIEIVKPDIVLFVIGPYYIHALYAALGIDEKELVNYKPCYKIKEGKKNRLYVRNITHLTNYDIPIYWSYHPAYLGRHHKIEELVERVKNGEIE